MRNFIVLGIEVLVCFIAIIILYKKYKTDGLISFVMIATIIATFLSRQEIDVLNTEIPLGMGLTMSIIIAANIITQNKGLEEVNNILLLVLVSSLVSCCLLNLSGIINPSTLNEFANKSYDSIFEYNIRIYIANTLSLLVGIFISSRIYYTLKRIKNKIIFSNIFSILIAEFLDNIIFIVLAYLYARDIPQIMFTLVIRYTLKIIIGIIGTATIYITKN